MLLFSLNCLIYSLLNALSKLNLICQCISFPFHFAVPPGNHQPFPSLSSLSNVVISAHFIKLLIIETSIFIKWALTESGFSHAENSHLFFPFSSKQHSWKYIAFQDYFVFNYYNLGAVNFIFDNRMSFNHFFLVAVLKEIYLTRPGKFSLTKEFKPAIEIHIP